MAEAWTFSGAIGQKMVDDEIEGERKAIILVDCSTISYWLPRATKAIPPTEQLSLLRVGCLFFSKKMPNNDEIPQSSIAFIVLVSDQYNEYDHNEYNTAFWHHRIV